jgi:hypothetical protein
MRMHIRRSNNRRRRKGYQEDDRRRSWHVGTTTSETQEGHRRSSHGVFHSTWHFHHFSRHSGHVVDDDHENGADPETTEDDCQQQQEQRRTFSSASYHPSNKQETATRAPSPPAGGESTTDTTAALPDPTTSTTAQPYSSTSIDIDGRPHLHRRGSSKRGWFKKIKQKTGRVWHAMEDFFFPGCLPLNHESQHQQLGADAARRRSVSPPQTTRTTRAGFPLATIQETVEVARTMHGKEGLRAAGFEFRKTSCPKHHHHHQQQQQQQQQSSKVKNVQDKDDDVKSEKQCSSGETFVGVNSDEGLERNRTASDEDTPALVPKEEVDKQIQTVQTALPVKESNGDQELDLPIPERDSEEEHFCRSCSSGLFHIPSDTRIDATNRKQFIADGDMYDAVAKLCQEYAQEVMIQQYGLVWVTVSEGLKSHDVGTGRCFLQQGHHEPIRALVNAEHPLVQNLDTNSTTAKASSAVQREYYSHRPTLLIVTGKGKVRAGIFSRQHLLASGMESSTALPLIHHARKRKLNVVIIDPNAHGDRVGNVTFEKSMEKLFPAWEEAQQQPNDGCRMINHDLYIISHSASGSHLVRYLLDDSDPKSKRCLSNIRAIAFTDSTHTIQVARQMGNDGLVTLLESDASIYFRCASAHMSENRSLHQAGHEAPRDEYWKKRFGNIRTLWAGTKEHSLTNWFALSFIWEHFDRFLKPESKHLDDKQDIDNDGIPAHQ